LRDSLFLSVVASDAITDIMASLFCRDARPRMERLIRETC
jgi:hypothetical protein